MRKLKTYKNTGGPIRLVKKSYAKPIIIYFVLILIFTTLAFVISYNVLSFQMKNNNKGFEATITRLENEKNSLTKENKQLKKDNENLTKMVTNLQATPTPRPTIKPTITPTPTANITRE